MKSYRKYKPYIRRANGNEVSESLRDAFRLVFYQMRGRPFYVMVQRGFPNDVIAVGPSKHEVRQSILAVQFTKMTFAQWASAIQKMATGKAAA